MTETNPFALLRKKTGRIAVSLTVGVWIVSSFLFVVPMLVAGQEMSFYLAASIVAIATGGSLVSAMLMIAIWYVFDSEIGSKILVS